MWENMDRADAMGTAKSSEVTLVIVNYNTCEDLRRCLESIYNSLPSFSFSTIVVDNHSTDGSVEMLKTYFPQVHLIENETNRGLVQAYNQAFLLVNTPYIVLLDSDTIVEPGALDKLYSFSSAHPEAGIVAPRLLNADGSIQQTARNLPSPLNALFGRQTLLTRLFPQNPWSVHYLRAQDLALEEPFAVEWISFACAMLKAELLQRVGFFDEDYFIYWIDADWCKRVNERGYKIFCLPEARVMHIEKNQRGKKRRPRSIIDFHRGSYLFYRKHYAASPWRPMAWIAFIGLSVRAGLLLVINYFRHPRKEEPSSVAPQAAGTREVN